MSAARIAAGAGALALMLLATYRLRTGRNGRAALGLLAAGLLTLYAADATSALPDGEAPWRTPGDALGAWTYPFMGAMAFLETSIPPVTLVFPGEWAVMLGGAMAGEGQIAHRPADRPGLGLLGGRGLGHVRARPPPGAALPACTRRADRGDRAPAGEARCLARPLRLGRRLPRPPGAAGAALRPARDRGLATSPTGASLPGTCSARCCSRSLFCGLGYVFYRSYDEVAAALSRSAFAFLLLIGGGHRRPT